jgi:hypothetical protein
VSFGILNLTHAESHEFPRPLEPGERRRVVVTLNNIAQHFPQGHSIRIAVSSSYWPLAWPSPRPARLTIYPEHSQLILPVRPPREEDRELRPFGPPRMAESLPMTLLAPADRRWNVNLDLGSNRVELNVVNNDARYRLDETQLEITRDVRETYSYANNDYATLRGFVEQVRKFHRADWSVSTETRTVLTSTATEFVIRATLDAYEGEARIFSKSWDEKVPRNLV